MAALAINKSLLKEFKTSDSDRTVFMEDGNEFQIQLFNPYPYRIGAKIGINGSWSISPLILRPGERVWLDRYLNAPDKFKFETYMVSGTNTDVAAAIANNGRVDVEFYKEEERDHNLISKSAPIWINTQMDSANDCRSVYYDNACNTVLNSGGRRYAKSYVTNATETSLSVQNAQNSVNFVSTLTASDNIPNMYTFGSEPKIHEKPATRSIETGRVEHGSHSDQKFDYINIDLCYCAFNKETIYIKPLSTKPVTSTDLNKKYCTNCGKKLSPKFKYCPACGAKV